MKLVFFILLLATSSFADASQYPPPSEGVPVQMPRGLVFRIRPVIQTQPGRCTASAIILLTQEQMAYYASSSSVIRNYNYRVIAQVPPTDARANVGYHVRITPKQCPADSLSLYVQADLVETNSECRMISAGAIGSTSYFPQTCAPEIPVQKKKRRRRGRL